jgi:hypothetical protein
MLESVRASRANFGASPKFLNRSSRGRVRFPEKSRATGSRAISTAMRLALPKEMGRPFLLHPKFLSQPENH